jgi:DNA repair and recombination protein RAD54B
MFSKILHPAHLDDLIQSSTAESLALISILTKISNSPILLKATLDNAKGKDTETASVRKNGVREALQHLPASTHIADMTLSGKFRCLAFPRSYRCLTNYIQGKLIVLSKILETLTKVWSYKVA